jgi:hypothetical protein
MLLLKPDGEGVSSMTIRNLPLWRLTPALAVLLFALPASATETKGFVVSWFHTAGFADKDSCPQGINPDNIQIWARSLGELGFTPSEAEKVISADGRQWRQLMTMRGKKDGKPANVYLYPLSAPDPHLKPVQGRYAYGFNLDGKSGPQSFEDPESHESGVDNQVFRAVGCSKMYHVNLPDRPYYEMTRWDIGADSMPAWVVTISGDDLNKDGDVTVTLTRSTRYAYRDAQAKPLADATYVMEPTDRSRNIFKGRIKGKVITVEPKDISIQAEAGIIPEYKFKNAQLRLSIDEKGNLNGYLGGYIAWQSYYWLIASHGSSSEESSLDVPGVYYALRKQADAEPDPVTGQNTLISSAFRIEGVPARILPPQVPYAERAQKVSSLTLQETGPRPARD